MRARRAEGERASWRSPPTAPGKWRRSLADKYFQCIEQRPQIPLTLINRRRCGATLEQDVYRFPRRASGVFDRKRHLLWHLYILADESEISGSFRNWGRSVGACARHPDVVHIGQVTGNADR